eukprot:scaffold102962_cov39-Tisochrysis_lutea.AAC.2
MTSNSALLCSTARCSSVAEGACLPWVRTLVASFEVCSGDGGSPAGVTAVGGGCSTGTPLEASIARSPFSRLRRSASAAPLALVPLGKSNASWRAAPAARIPGFAEPPPDCLPSAARPNAATTLSSSSSLADTSLLTLRLALPLPGRAPLLRVVGCPRPTSCSPASSPSVGSTAARV